MQYSVLNTPTFCSISYFDDNLFHWQATIIGPSDSPYSGSIFFLDIYFPSNYLLKPPEIWFITRIYHLNIDNRKSVIVANLLYINFNQTFITQTFVNLSIVNLPKPRRSTCT
ncbi:ubiquitin-conjugating enzyme-like protein [Rhizophagus irregularis DAOM 181602=DAOM 197198]|nr:ubiquitin-conjugating enzyme-like protein [Rhizophagus irregularis DAOM 181602=DAOM 197198]